MYDILQLNDMLVPELRELAEKIGLENSKKLSKQDLIYKILDQQALNKSTVATDTNVDSKENAQAPGYEILEDEHKKNLKLQQLMK